MAGSSNKWSDAARRFGFYFIGLAIGLVLLGFFQMKKQQQAAEIKAREQAAQQATQQAAQQAAQPSAQPQSAPAAPPHAAPSATPTNINTPTPASPK